MNPRNADEGLRPRRIGENGVVGSRDGFQLHLSKACCDFVTLFCATIEATLVWMKSDIVGLRCPGFEASCDHLCDRRASSSTVGNILDCPRIEGAGVSALA